MYLKNVNSVLISIDKFGFRFLCILQVQYRITVQIRWKRYYRIFELLFSHTKYVTGIHHKLFGGERDIDCKRVYISTATLYDGSDQIEGKVYLNYYQIFTRNTLQV